jgi:predicted RNase H-like HicB family nuclease
MEFNFELEQDEATGQWTARVVEVPEAIASGATQQEALCAAAALLDQALCNRN